jgi:hypothetical protein
LGYLVRQFAAGKLVARDPADVETKLIELAERAMAIAEEAHTREGDWRAAAAVNRQRPFDPEAR